MTTGHILFFPGGLSEWKKGNGWADLARTVGHFGRVREWWQGWDTGTTWHQVAKEAAGTGMLFAGYHREAMLPKVDGRQKYRRAIVLFGCFP